jgi:ureidoacrylate peracid hydrolase
MPVTLLTREIEIEPEHAALLFIDVQNYSANPDAPRFNQLSSEKRESQYGFFFRTMQATAVPNMQRVQAACRRAGIEVIYTVIENLTKNGRDRSLDYKISGLDVSKGSWEARVLDAIAPSGDEIVLPKTSSSVFISTNIDYVLRNLGVRFLLIAGILTDQCVDSAIRDACDLGYLVTVITDACATHSQERHDWSLRNNRGYARQRTTDQIVGEIERLCGAAGR